MCPGGSYSSTTGASSCIKCSAGYYSNQGAASCTKCSTKYPNCKTCNNTQCIECETNYKLSDDKQKCEKRCPNKTIEIDAGGKKLCVTQYNIGDASEFPLSGVSVVSTNSYCNGYSACCWRGGVTSNLNVCNADNGGYSGCRRPVCTHSAAQIVCANLKYDNRKWRLPTNSELSYFYYASKDKGSSGLMICDRSSNGYYGFSACSGTSSGCDNASNSSCAPGYLWTSQLNKTSTAYRWDLYKGGWDYKSSSRLLPLSVRCVTELKEK